MGKFDERHHKSHFDQLVYVIAELCTRGLGYVFDERLYSAVVGNKHLYLFEMLINILESERTSPVEFLQAVENIRAEFPEKMPAELRAKLPNSTNASESNHWLLYRAVGFGFDLWEGIRRLYRFQREMEMLYAEILGPCSTPRCAIGSKPQPESRIKWHPNDGRAPDTRERLEAIEKIEGEFNTLNAALTDAERWDAVNSAPSPAHAPHTSPKSIPPTPLSRQSYRWDEPQSSVNEYELQWLECNDGTVYYSSFSNLPVLMLHTIYRSRKFLKEVQDVQITEKQARLLSFQTSFENFEDPTQIGNICLPFYMIPDDPNHKNPTLTAIFDAALPLVAEILASWNNGHSVIRSFETFFIKKKKHAHAREADNWMHTLGLDPTPELEAVLTDMGHDALLGITNQECNIRVMGVGSVLFQLLAVQQELGEPLDLNGDLIEDLKDDSVVACWPDGDAALNAMFSAIPTTSTKSGVLFQQMLAFKRDHTIFDKEFRPPTFRRDRRSRFHPTDPIPVVVNDTSKRKKTKKSMPRSPPNGRNLTQRRSGR
ncbi:hypothetical protein C8J57DRAFT_1527386 [Mycena rebaudengoi]|nr:hypothetical protein C8J57DRAFT_1527386 [Mycena rebaudengoi]